MILPFSRFFTIVRNAVSTLCRWPKNSRLSTLVDETTFVRFILFRIYNKFSSNFLCLTYIHRPRCYQKIPPKRKARPRVLRTMKKNLWTFCVITVFVTPSYLRFLK